MQRPNASPTFAANGDVILWLSLAGHYFGHSPSERLGIRDKLLALEFDAYCAYKLRDHEIEKENGKRKFLARLMGGDPDSEDAETDIPDGAEVW